MAKEDVIARLIRGIDDESGIIEAVAGKEPLSDREQALIVAARIFYTQSKPSETTKDRRFNHESKSIYEACGIDEEAADKKLRTIAAWIASEQILTGEGVKKSRLIERILNVSDDEVERLLIARSLN